MHPYLSLALAIIFEVTATSFLKATDGFRVLLPSLIVVAGYGLAFFFLSLTLRSMPVGIAYAIWAGAGTALICLVGWLWYRQPLDLPAILGVALITAGVAVLQLYSKTVSH